MNSKALVQRALALDDVDQAITHYLDQGAIAAERGRVLHMKRDIPEWMSDGADETG